MPATVRLRLETRLLFICFFLPLGSQAQANIDILNQNWDGSDTAHFGSTYQIGNSTATKTIQAGAGVGNTNAVVFATNFASGTCTSGFSINTTSNPNLTVTDPSLINISFDLRATTAGAAMGTVDFYIQSWPGVYGNPRDGTWSIRFTPTTDYKTYTFNLGSLHRDAGNVIPNHQTIQMAWQLGTQYDGWSLGQHSLTIDNIRLTAVPAPGSLITALIGGVPGVLWLRRRRK